MVQGRRHGIIKTFLTFYYIFTKRITRKNKSVVLFCCPVLAHYLPQIHTETTTGKQTPTERRKHAHRRKESY